MNRTASLQSEIAIWLNQRGMSDQQHEVSEIPHNRGSSLVRLTVPFCLGWTCGSFSFAPAASRIFEVVDLSLGGNPLPPQRIEPAGDHKSATYECPPIGDVMKDEPADDDCPNRHGISERLQRGRGRVSESRRQ